jgi:hypothetical protein
MRGKPKHGNKKRTTSGQPADLSEKGNIRSNKETVKAMESTMCTKSKYRTAACEANLSRKQRE